MAYKFNTLKSIKKGLIGPNILFPAAYLLFSAEVCTGGAGNKPTNQMHRRTLSSLSAKPVAHPDKIEEAVVDQTDKIEEEVELSKDNTDALEAAESVDQTDEIEEALEGSEGNTDGLKAAESVDPLDKKKEGREGSNDNKAKVSTASAPVGAQAPPAPGAAQAAEGGTPPPPPPGTPAPQGQQRQQATRVSGTPPPPPLPMTDLEQAPAFSIMLRTVSLNQDTAQQSKQSVQQKPNQDTKAIGNLNDEMKITFDLKKLSSDPLHQECMNKILQSLPSKYTMNIRSVFIKRYLEESEGTYSYTKEQAVKWFLDQHDDDIKKYREPILNLVLKKVKENEAAYDSEKVSLLKSLTENID